MAEQIIVGKTLVNLNVRNSAGGEKLGFSLPVGISIQGDIKINQWIHLTKVDGEAVLSEQWISDGGGQYVDWKWIDAPDPDPEPLPDPESSPDPNVVSIIKTFDDGSVTINGTAFPL